RWRFDNSELYPRIHCHPLSHHFGGSPSLNKRAQASRVPRQRQTIRKGGTQSRESSCRIVRLPNGVVQRKDGAGRLPAMQLVLRLRACGARTFQATHQKVTWTHLLSLDQKRFAMSSRISNAVVRFLKHEDGPTAVEYAVMLALIIVVCIVAI